MVTRTTPQIKRNEHITASQVRLIDVDGKPLGVVPIEDALDRARQQHLDLVQVTHQSDTPVCRIMDFGQFLSGDETGWRRNDIPVEQSKIADTIAG